MSEREPSRAGVSPREMPRLDLGALVPWSSASVRRRFVILGGLLAALFAALAPSASSAPLQLVVNFSVNGEISLTLPDGTPVGTSSGPPTVIPAGYYVLTLTQPGCIQVPAFILQGPGVNIEDDLQSGEVVSDADAADLQPNSTYVWRNGAQNPPVNYTFMTSGDVVGTPPPPSQSQPVSTGSNKAESNTDLLGSSTASPSQPPFLGTLTGAVSAAGRVTLLERGKAVTRLEAGRYALTVSLASRTSGFVLGDAGGAVASTPASATGKHTLSVDLTTGTWYYAAHAAGPKTYFRVVG